MRILKTKSGLTLAEMVVSLGVLMLIVVGMSSLLVDSSKSTDRTQMQSKVDTEVALAEEKIFNLLIEARRITIDANGNGITYHFPAKNEDGSYKFSHKAVDSVAHRIYLTNGSLYSSDDPDNPILTNIPSRDPETGSTIRIFSAGVNGKEVVVRLVSTQAANPTCSFTSAITTRIRPRNI